MDTFPETDPPHSLTIQLAPVHLAWLEKMANQGNSDVSTIVFWIIHTASRMNDDPWPLGFNGWSPFPQE